jgi:hypothetical protein
MVEQNAHHVPNFAASPGCSFQMFKPQLHFDGHDVRQEVVSPTRHDPLAKIALIGLLGRVRDSPVRAAKLSLLKMLSQLRQRHCGPRQSDVWGIDFPHQSGRHLAG